MQIVAPAGNLKGLKASINGGADAVYLGLPQFGARAKADNFTFETLDSAIEFAHLLGVKVFVTLNTLIKDGEMKSALNAAKTAFELGADAAIVQDIRFIKELKNAFPEAVLHASTQMGIHNADGAEILRDLGIKRAVLARETLPEDIAEIKKTGIEIEYFVQGALCVCFSGNCYFSSLASSYSGNRGKCMQLCRKPYIFHGNRGYYLSAKDLCLYDKLEELEALGVDAVKIEGRMRSSEYAYTATKVYKSYPDTPNAVEALKSVFNRGDYCNGYLDANAPFNVIYPEIQSNIGIYAGRISKTDGNKIVIRGFTPHDDDGFKIIRNGAEVCGASVKNGAIVSECACKCKVGDEVRRTFDGAMSHEIGKKQRLLDVVVNVELKAEKPMQATLNAEGHTLHISSDSTVSRATSRGLEPSDVERAFNKVAEYPFAPTISVETDGEAFVPISALNSFRRDCYAAVKAAVLDGRKTNKTVARFSGLDYNRFEGKGKILMVESSKQLSDIAIDGADYIALNPRDYSDFEIPHIDKPILLNLPIVMRGEDRRVIRNAINRKGVYGVISNNLYTLSITDKPILLGTGHNIIGVTDLPHIRSFEADAYTRGFIYAFGYAPVMTLCHCPYGKCVNCSGDDILTDDSGRKFALRRFKTAHCYWQLLNCDPHYTADITMQKNTENLFYDCTAVDRSTVIKVIKGTYDGKFTRGNINKGLK